VRDRRHVTTAAQLAGEAFAHLRVATNSGRVRPALTVFAPTTPERAGPRIWNEQLIRYAGYRQPDGTVIGDPRYADFTSAVRDLGWPGGPGTPFDVLPLVVQVPGEGPALFDLPRDVVLEVPLSHPRYPWFSELGLRWHAVPAISNMCLEIGGVCYPAAPFNGWYMGTEIGARNLADVHRYDVVPVVARRLGLDPRCSTATTKRRPPAELCPPSAHDGHHERGGVGPRGRRSLARPAGSGWSCQSASRWRSATPSWP